MTIALTPAAARTMVYTVDLGNGQVADVEAPEGTTPEQLQAAVQAQQGAPDQSTETASPVQPEFGDDSGPSHSLSPDDEAAYGQLLHTGSVADLQAFLHQRGLTSDAGKLDAFVAGRDHAKANGGAVDYGVRYERGPAPYGEDTDARRIARQAAQGATLGSADEIHGFLSGVDALVHGRGYTDAYNRTVDADRAQLGYDEANHGVESTLANLGGGLLTPFGLEKSGAVASLDAVALRAGQDAIAAGATPEAAKAIAARAVTRRLATEGGAYGGAYGTAGSEGDPGQRLVAGAENAGLGAAGGALFGKLGERLGIKRASAPTTGQDVLAAGDRLGIQPFAADVGGPTTRRITSGIAQTPGGAKQIIDAAQAVTAGGKAARDQIAGTLGNVLNPSETGEAALAGAKSFIARTSTQGNAMYRAAEQAANGARVTPTEALATLNRHIAELGQTPGGADGLSRLQGLRDALSQGDFSVQGIRNMRTALRDDFANAGLRGSDIERRANQVVDAANQDVVNSLNAQGNGQAAALYAKADQFWRDRLQTIDSTLAPIIGKNGDRSGEQVAAALQSNLRGNGARLDKFINALPAAEQANVRASLVGRLGTATKGTQNAEGDAFSLPTFLTHWNEISDSSKARLFGPETRAALNDLAKVAQGSKEAQRYANHSNTGGVVGLVGTVATGAFGLKTLGFGLAGPYAAGKLLASPKFARWLARAPRTSLGATSYIERLGRIAQAEPAIAGEVLRFRDRLQQAVSGGSMRAAAESDNSADVIDGQGGQQQAQQQMAP